MRGVVVYDEKERINNIATHQKAKQHIECYKRVRSQSRIQPLQPGLDVYRWVERKHEGPHLRSVLAPPLHQGLRFNGLHRIRTGADCNMQPRAYNMSQLRDEFRASLLSVACRYSLCETVDNQRHDIIRTKNVGETRGEHRRLGEPCYDAAAFPQRALGGEGIAVNNRDMWSGRASFGPFECAPELNHRTGHIRLSKACVE